MGVVVNIMIISTACKAMKGEDRQGYWAAGIGSPGPTVLAELCAVSMRKEEILVLGEGLAFLE